MFTLIFLILTCISILIFIIYEKNSENKSKSTAEKVEKLEVEAILEQEKEIPVNNNNNNNNNNISFIANNLELQMIDDMKKITNTNSKPVTDSCVQAILPNLDGASPI
tara:strand:- start:14649 stop:14972 length:324 start_codon:yes stop_codon:yes gene_type:complete